VTMLAALIATAALFAGSTFAGWARPAGVLAGALCAWRRLPFVVVVVAAAGTTALLRLAGLD
jgi:branched chain amino acid efflux pump